MSRLITFSQALLEASFPLEVPPIEEAVYKSSYKDEVFDVVDIWPSNWKDFNVDLAYRLIQLIHFLTPKGIVSIIPPMLLCFMTEFADVLYDFLLTDIGKCFKHKADYPQLRQIERSAIITVLAAYMYEISQSSLVNDGKSQSHFSDWHRTHLVPEICQFITENTGDQIILEEHSKAFHVTFNVQIEWVIQECRNLD